MPSARDSAPLYRNLLRLMFSNHRGAMFDVVAASLSPGVSVRLDVLEDRAELAYVVPDAGAFRVCVGMGLADLGVFIESIMNGVTSGPLRGPPAFAAILTGSKDDPRLVADWGQLQISVFGLAVEFVLAHEVGHVVAGHFDLLRRRSAPRLCFSEAFDVDAVTTAQPAAGLTAAEWQTIELHADLIGAYLMRGASEVHASQFLIGVRDPDLRFLLTRFAQVCTAFWFAYRSSAKGPPSAWLGLKHPHPLVRLTLMENDAFNVSREETRRRASEALTSSQTWTDWLATAPAHDPDYDIRATYERTLDQVVALDQQLGDFRKRIAALRRPTLWKRLKTLLTGRRS